MCVKKIKSYSYYLTFDGTLIIYVRDMSGTEYSVAEISNVKEGTENEMALEVLKELGYEIQEGD